MAFQAVPDAAEAVITYTGHGKTFKNVVQATKSGGYDLADLVVLAAAVDLTVATDWLPLQNVNYLYINTTVRGLAFLNDQETVNSVGAGAGTVAGAALPDNVTLSLKKSSELTGRNARGRLYWIGTNASDIASNENQYIQANADAIRDAVDALRADITATVWDAAIVSRFLDGAERAEGVTFEWRDTLLVDINVDSQRRRLL